jgi:hypothetical protein
MASASARWTSSNFTVEIWNEEDEASKETELAAQQFSIN